VGDDIGWCRKRNGGDSERSEVGLSGLDEVVSSCSDSVDDLGTLGDDEAT